VTVCGAVARHGPSSLHDYDHVPSDFHLFGPFLEASGKRVLSTYAVKKLSPPGY
jgi:hypothetical protein